MQKLSERASLIDLENPQCRTGSNPEPKRKPRSVQDRLGKNHRAYRRGATSTAEPLLFVDVAVLLGRQPPLGNEVRPKNRKLFEVIAETAGTS